MVGQPRAIRAPEYVSAFSRTIEVMLFRRIRPMPLEIHSTTRPEPTIYDRIGLRADWGEQVVTIIAVSMGVLVVALIAVLMGMA